MEFMKISVYLIKMVSLFVVISLFSVDGYSQINNSDFDAYRKKNKEEFNKFQEDKERTFNAFRDSLNAAYSTFLEQTWESFQLFKQEIGFVPMPEPPVYDPTDPIPEDNRPQPVVNIEPLPKLNPLPIDVDPVPPVLNVEPIDQRPKLPVSFFGTRVYVQPLSVDKYQSLLGVSENEVAAYWKFLSTVSVDLVIEDIFNLKRSLSLDDWGTYQLVNSLFDAYILDGTENERVVFSAFMLNQLGYGAKIGRSGGELYVLLDSQEKLLNTSYFTFSDKGKNKKYYVMNPHHKSLAYIQTCSGVYDSGALSMNLNVNKLPVLSVDEGCKKLSFESREYSISYNQNMVDYYATFPYLDFSLYADAPIDKITLDSFYKEILPFVEDKTQEDAVNFLLHFVQNAFEYMTDPDQYGYEKWNFVEETIVSAYSDCDDRAIIFAQLVRILLDMDVVLIYYPGVHLAAAVHFDNPNTEGAYVTVDGQKFLICDPTYINADLGMAMPDLQNTSVEILRLR